MKRIVVCCDGTWNDGDSPSVDTNVFRMAKAIHGNDGEQIVLYQQGVGTTGLKIGDLIEGAIGLGVDENIRSAYMFIAQNYVPGDEIFLFGFSRGGPTRPGLCPVLSALVGCSASETWRPAGGVKLLSRAGAARSCEVHAELRYGLPYSSNHPLPWCLGHGGSHGHPGQGLRLR